MYANLELEREAIGMLLTWHDLWQTAINDYGFTEETFIDEKHRDFFNQGRKLLEQGESDFGVISFSLCSKDMAYFTGLMTRDILPEFASQTFSKLKQLEYARKARNGAAEIISATESIGTVPDVEDVVARLDELRNELAEHSNIGRVETLEDVARESHEFIRQGLRVMPLFGSGTLGDRAFSFHEGETMVLSGTTGTGKTALAAQWALTMALTGKRVLYVCTESTAKEIYLRFVATMCGIPHYQAADNTREGAAFRLCAARMPAGLGSSLFFHCLKRSKPKTDDIERKIQQIEKQYGKVDALFIDYIQDIGYPSQMHKLSELQKIEEVIDRIHDMCLFHGISGIYLSQLNRTGEKDKPPTNEQIKNASKIAEKAHIVCFLWRRKVGVVAPDAEEMTVADDGAGGFGTSVNGGKEDYSYFYSSKCRNTRIFNLKMKWEGTRYMVKDDKYQLYPIYGKITQLLPELSYDTWSIFDELYTRDMEGSGWEDRTSQNYGGVETFSPFTAYR